MMMNPDGLQAQSVMKDAIANAGIAVEDVDCVVAHAPGTVADDMAEAIALAHLFGNRVGSIPVVSIKSMLGHSQGACGTLEVAAGAISLRKHTILRTINCENPDPRCGLTINRERPLNLGVRHLLLNTFGFGGKNASVVLRALDG
jgi:3-oxoacyl-[acyl-carrier-protein] synthase II